MPVYTIIVGKFVPSSSCLKLIAILVSKIFIKFFVVFAADKSVFHIVLNDVH